MAELLETRRRQSFFKTFLEALRRLLCVAGRILYPRGLALWFAPDSRAVRLEVKIAGAAAAVEAL